MKIFAYKAIDSGRVYKAKETYNSINSQFGDNPQERVSFFNIDGSVYYLSHLYRAKGKPIGIDNGDYISLISFYYPFLNKHPRRVLAMLNHTKSTGLEDFPDPFVSVFLTLSALITLYFSGRWDTDHYHWLLIPIPYIFGLIVLSRSFYIKKSRQQFIQWAKYKYPNEVEAKVVGESK